MSRFCGCKERVKAASREIAGNHKALTAWSSLSIKLRGFEQDNHSLVEMLHFVSVINPIHVNISQPTKNLDFSSGNICKLEHEIYRHAE